MQPTTTVPSSTPPEARPASTVILCRPGVDADGVERFHVLLVKRHGKSGFMGGAHVFPGGRVDPEDHAPLVPGAAGLLDGLDDTAASAFLNAAVRETKEEAGIDVPPGALVPWSWWITPKEEPKRFDTRFFLCPVPEGVATRIDEHEAVAFAWLTPRQALDAYAQGDIVLAPPTLCTLEDLAPYQTILEAARHVRRPLPPVCPKIVAPSVSGLILALPGDPLHEVKERAFATRTRVFLDDKGRLTSQTA